MLKREKTKQTIWNLKIEWSERRLFLEKSGLDGVYGGEKVITVLIRLQADLGYKPRPQTSHA